MRIISWYYIKPLLQLQCVGIYIEVLHFLFYIVAIIDAHQFGQYERNLNMYQYFSNGTTYT